MEEDERSPKKRKKKKKFSFEELISQIKTLTWQDETTKLLAFLGAMIIIGIIVLILGVSCSKKRKEAEQYVFTTTEETTEETEPETESKVYVKHTEEECAAAGVDELYSVPILMYHQIVDMPSADTGFTGGNVDAEGYDRTAEAFEADLEKIYLWGYRCISLSDYVDGYIDVELGYSPVVITFDQGAGQCQIDGFDENGEPILKENTALYIMEEIKEEHPDFNLTATFFLTDALFGNGEELDTQLLKWLVKHDYDIANNTLSYANLEELDSGEIENEVVGMYKRLENIIGDKYTNIVALPYGIPENCASDSKYDKIFHGLYDGREYYTRAAVLNGTTRQVSPFINLYDSTCIERIKAYDNGSTDNDILSVFSELNGGKKFVSDGNPNVITIHYEDEIYLGETFGRELVTY